MSPTNPPKSVPLADILPDEPMLLMGAGPVPLPPAVARANSVVINHLGKTMDKVIANVKDMARYAFQTKADKIIGISGPSSAGMEMAIANLVWPGRRVLVLEIGTFSKRFGEMAEAVGGEVEYLSANECQPITLDQVKKEMQGKQFDVVTTVQGETSCGVLNTELEEITKYAKSRGALVIVDGVCTLTTMPLQMDDWDIDVVITGGQKGLSTIPGVSMVAFSDDAWAAIEHRTKKKYHWVLDAERAQRFWGHQEYHYTAPVPGILALHEALRLICEETLAKRFQRHRQSSQALQAGIESMGLKLFIPKKHRLNSVVAIELSKGVDCTKVREHMADNFGVEIAGAFGLDIIRIGQMGEQCRGDNLLKTLHALGASAKHAGANVDVSSGMAALEKKLEEANL